ncbi:MAG: class I SAM-dependent methyltransferase, partial [Gammaproteobacteria bacterium]
MNKSGKPSGDPDRAQALTQYRQRAAVYDLELAPFEPIRRMAIARLALQRGDVVLDVGCGTGLSLALLRQEIGAKGRIIAIDQSPEMIAKARERVVQNQWKNVTLLCLPIELADIPGLADAALLHFTHDILRRLDAIGNVARHLKPPACVVASGLKWSWVFPANLLVGPAAWHSVTTLEGLDRPWSRLAKCIGPLHVETLALDTIY